MPHSKRIEFIGPPGVGKSFLHEIACNIIKNKNIKNVIPLFNLDTETLIKNKYCDINFPNIENLINTSLHLLGESNTFPKRRLMRSVWLYKSIQLAKIIESCQDPFCFLVDESICQRGHSICVTSKNENKASMRYFREVPCPLAVINVFDRIENIEKKIKNRKSDNIKEELSTIQKSINIFHIAKEILESRGVFVLDINAGVNINKNAKILESFLKKIDSLQRIIPLKKQSLDTRYTGKTAVDYEKERTCDDQWGKENFAVNHILKHIKPKTLLDIPIGTGRFISLYKENNISTTGVDISWDMIRESEKKNNDLPYKIKILKGSIFSLDFLKNSFECSVCMRFLNWIDEEKLFIALKSLYDKSEKYIIISLRTTDTSSKSLKLDNNFIIHSYHVFSIFIEKIGLNIVEKRYINKRYGGEFNIYLLEKKD